MKRKVLVFISAIILLILSSIAYFLTYVGEKYDKELMLMEKNINWDMVDINDKLIKKRGKKERIFIIGFSLLILATSTIIISNKKK